MSKAVVDDDYVHTVIGTRHYRAPEMLRRQRYGPKVDLWLSTRTAAS
jgi:serine/threonine protein kinase